MLCVWNDRLVCLRGCVLDVYGARACFISFNASIECRGRIHNRMTGHTGNRREPSPSWTLEEDDSEDEEDAAADNRLGACGEVRKNVFDVEISDDGIELDGRFFKNNAKRYYDLRNPPIHDEANSDTAWAANGRRTIHRSDDDGDDDDDDDDNILPCPENNDRNKDTLSTTSSSFGSLAWSSRGSHRLGGGDAPISIACLEHVVGENGPTGRDEDVLDLDELIRRQQESVSHRRRGSVLDIVPSTHRARQRDAHGRTPRKRNVLTLEESWTQYIRTLPNTFFRSNEALMNRAESAIRGKPLFSGL
jgi:hypothetical protein